MVTPVHRFHQVDSITNQFSGSQQPRRSRPSHTSPPPYSNGGEGCSEMGRGSHAEVDSSVYLEPVVGTPPPGGGHLEMDMPHAQPLPHHHSLPVGKLRCSMWASFAFVTVFVAGAKFYFDHQGTGMEVLVICTVIVVVMYILAACARSLCRSKGQPPPPTSEGPPNTPVTRLELIQVLPNPPPISPPQQQAQQQHQLVYSQQQVQVEAPPPPYHIAIDLPQCITPPPSYEKAIS